MSPLIQKYLLDFKFRYLSSINSKLYHASYKPEVYDINRRSIISSKNSKHSLGFTDRCQRAGHPILQGNQSREYNTSGSSNLGDSLRLAEDKVRYMIS